MAAIYQFLSAMYEMAMVTLGRKPCNTFVGLDINKPQSNGPSCLPGVSREGLLTAGGRSNPPMCSHYENKKRPSRRVNTSILERAFNLGRLLIGAPGGMSRTAFPAIFGTTTAVLAQVQQRPLRITARRRTLGRGRNVQTCPQCKKGRWRHGNESGAAPLVVLT
jgi:hypothetical protein